MAQRLCLWILVCVALAGCDTGTFTLQIADAPLDTATAVNIHFTAVELERSDGGVERFDIDDRTIDLLQLREGDALALLDGERLAEGSYTAIRLEVDDSRSSFVEGATIHALELVADPDLEAEYSFTMERRESASVTIDFDLRRSILPPEAGATAFRLRPALRAVETSTHGVVQGFIADARIVSDCSPAVYVYNGRGATPDDIGGGGTQPITSSRVFDGTSGDNRQQYFVPFLAPGEYTAAFTCQAATDDPSTAQDDDDVRFDAKSFTLTESDSERLDFD